MGLLCGIEKWDGISLHHPQIPQPWNPLRAFLDAVHEGLADSEAGHVIDDASLTAELDAALDSPAQS